MSDAQVYQQRFLLTVEGARMHAGEKSVWRACARLRLMFPCLRPLLNKNAIYIHPYAQNLAAVLDGQFPSDTVHHAARYGKLCVLRMEGSRELWFLCTRGSAAGAAVTTVTVDSTTFSLWAARGTDTEILSRLVQRCCQDEGL